jgi:hypothetical protein
MSDYVTKKCDECGGLMDAAVKWWCATGDQLAPRFSTFSAEAGRSEDGFRTDYCSHSCVITAFNRWLDTGSLVVVPRPLGVEAAPDVMPEDEYARLVHPSVPGSLQSSIDLVIDGLHARIVQPILDELKDALDVMPEDEYARLVYPSVEELKTQLAVSEEDALYTVDR